MDLHPDFRDLLAEFVGCGVRFALIGGYAVSHHAKPRATKDLDVVPVIGLEDLLANKRAAGRKRDLADVEILERVREGLR